MSKLVLRSKSGRLVILLSGCLLALVLLGAAALSPLAGVKAVGMILRTDTVSAARDYDAELAASAADYTTAVTSDDYDPSGTWAVIRDDVQLYATVVMQQRFYPEARRPRVSQQQWRIVLFKLASVARQPGVPALTPIDGVPVPSLAKGGSVS